MTYEETLGTFSLRLPSYRSTDDLLHMIVQYPGSFGEGSSTLASTRHCSLFLVLSGKNLRASVPH
jgi:hypothetical protein